MRNKKEIRIDEHTVYAELRDLLNWVAVFEEEYDLPAEVVGKLRERIENIVLLLEAGDFFPPTRAKRLRRQSMQAPQAAQWDYDERMQELEDAYVDRYAQLAEELDEDEITPTEEGFVRGYWRERARH